MKLISAIHRWAGGVIGLLLALLGLSGAILVWEGQWLVLPGADDPVVADISRLAAITKAAVAEGELSTITFASDEIGLHQLIYADGSGAYVRQDGLVVDRWSSQWGRPELWLFDLHHRLFAGETGKTVTGVAGIAGLLFAVTGAILWWRSRRSFRLRLLPERFAPGPIVRHHRDLGIAVMPLLMISIMTGVLMLFEPVRNALLGTEFRPVVTEKQRSIHGPAEALALAKSRFPNAALRRITLGASRGDPIVVRMRQPFEWTPNGRSQVSVAPDGTVTIQDAAAANRAAFLSEKAYPVHSAKVGGLAWKLAMTASGIALAVLGALATWSFWARRARRRVLKQEHLRLSASEV